MPKYTYKCSTCNKEVQKFASISDTIISCTCGEDMSRKMPIIKSPKVTEVIDKYSNKKHVEDQKSKLQERKLDYYWKHEVPKMVDSGVYALDTMLEQDWVYYDEKGSLVTRIKPPQKS